MQWVLRRDRKISEIQKTVELKCVRYGVCNSGSGERWAARGVRHVRQLRAPACGRASSGGRRQGQGGPSAALAQAGNVLSYSTYQLAEKFLTFFFTFYKESQISTRSFRELCGSHISSFFF